MERFEKISEYLKKNNINFNYSMLIQNLYFIRRIESFLQEGGNTVINKYKISIPELGQEDYIIIEETKNYNRKNYLLNTKDNDTQCLLMFKENDHMYIESLNSFDNCLTIKGKKINGSFLIQVAIQFTESIKKSENIRKIVLIDKAEKQCNNIYLNLSDFKILVSGDTWYGGYGFLPAIRDNNNFFNYDNMAIKLYNKNKFIISKLLVKDSKLQKIIKKKIKKISDTKILEIYNDFYEFIKNKENEFLSIVLSNFFTYKEFNKRCIILDYIIKKLFKKNNLISFRDRFFVKKI